MPHPLILIGAFLHFLGSSFYLKETLVGHNKPNRVSFLMWGFAPLIATTAAISDGVGWAALPVFMTGFFPLLTFFASFVNPKAYWKLNPSDFLCGVFSLLALALWAITRDANATILFALLSDGFATIPTVTKVWVHPETETPISYFAAGLNHLTALLTVKSFAFSSVAFPIYIIVSNTIILGVIYRKRFF